MIRLVLFLIFLTALAFGGAWLADRPGEINVVWQGWNIQTTVPVALAVLAVLTGVMMVMWRTLSLLLRSPQLISAFSTRRRKEKGWNAVTRGLLAIGTGDAAGARAARAEAARLLPEEPLTQLLSAQTAQFEGNKELAIAHFRAMAEKPSTRLLGLRGLHMEARRAGDFAAASAFADEAAQSAPTLGWAAEAVIETRCADGDFAGARAVLERQMAQKGIDKAQYRRRRAVLLAAEALALEHNDPLVARERAVEAVRLAPTLVPAAACAGRLLGAAGELRKAAKIVETAYAANPHPELAEVDAHLRPGDAAQDRLKRIRTLAARAPSHRESAIALAHAAIDAHEFKQARLVLEPLLDAPSQRVCLLMAELEAAENGDIGKAREWTARAVRATRDPAWIADGMVFDHWAPISPVSGKLDAFEWAVPPGVSSTPILEHEAERVKAAIAAVRASEEAKAAALLAAAAAEEVAKEAEKKAAQDAAQVVAKAAAKAKEIDPPAASGADDASKPAAPQGSEPDSAKADVTRTEAAKTDASKTDPAPTDPAKAPKAGAPAAQPAPGEPAAIPLGKDEPGKGMAEGSGPSRTAPAPDAAKPAAATGDGRSASVGQAAAHAATSNPAEAPGAAADEDRVVRLPQASGSRASGGRASASPASAAEESSASGAGASASPAHAAQASAPPAAAQGSVAPAPAARAPASQGSASQDSTSQRASSQGSGGQAQPSAAPARGGVSGSASVASAAPAGASAVANDRRRPSRVEPIIAMPPLPDDPGPGPEEPEEPQPPGRRPRFLEL